jgi:CheY-like chemotaxis protein
VNPRQARLAHMRHDLRTPLNAVIGYSNLMIEEVADFGPAQLAADLEQLRAAGDELLRIVNGTVFPDAGGSEDDMDLDLFAAGLTARLSDPAVTLIDCCSAARTKAASLEASEVLPDLYKVGSAAAHLLVLVESLQDEVDGPDDDGAEQLPPFSALSPASVEGLAPPTGHPILIVDDSEVNRDLLARQLRREGHAIADAENGVKALEMLRTADFDLVLVDILMPRMNGDEVLRELKADHRLRDIPVIMISALDEIDMVVRCIELGAEDYLPKPADPVLLRARVGASLEKKRLRDAEVDYLSNVEHLTAAAAAVEVGDFEPAALEQVADRTDELGRLARVFRRMASEVRAREQRLKSEVRQLRIEVDEAKTARNVAEITETDYFQDLLRKVDSLRLRADDEPQ